MLVPRDYLFDPGAYPREPRYWSLREALRGELAWRLAREPLRVQRVRSLCDDRVLFERVRVLGCLEFVADARQCRVFVNAVAADGSREPARVMHTLRRAARHGTPAHEVQVPLPADARLGHPFCAPWWIRLATWRWFPEVFDDPQQVWSSAPLHESLSTIHAEVWHWLSKQAEYLALGPRIVAELTLLRPVRAQLGSGPGKNLDVDRVSHLNRIWPALSRVASCADQGAGLTSMMLAYCLDPSLPEIDPQHPLRSIRLALRAAGVSRAEWARLASEGDKRVAWAWNGSSTLQPEDAFDLAVTALQICQRLGVRFCGQGFVRLWQACFGSGEPGQPSFFEDWAQLPTQFFRQAAEQSQRVDEAGWMRDVALIADWLSSLQPMAQRYWARQPWAECLARASAAKAKRDRLHRGALEQLTPDLSARMPQPREGRAVHLCTTAMLLEEGWSMRNCLPNLVDAVRAGREFIVSVRDARSGHSLGDVAVSCDPRSRRWFRSCASGSCNKPAPAWMAAYGETLRAWLQQQGIDWCGNEHRVDATAGNGTTPGIGREPAVGRPPSSDSPLADTASGPRATATTSEWLLADGTAMHERSR